MKIIREINQSKRYIRIGSYFFSFLCFLIFLDNLGNEDNYYLLIPITFFILFACLPGFMTYSYLYDEKQLIQKNNFSFKKEINIKDIEKIVFERVNTKDNFREVYDYYYVFFTHNHVLKINYYEFEEEEVIALIHHCLKEKDSIEVNLTKKKKLKEMLKKLKE